VAIHDPQVATPTQSFDDAVRDADAVVVATNHSGFRGPQRLARIAELGAGDPLVVDPWNCFGAAQVFGYASENFVLGLADGAERHLPGAPQA
jgi:UDP-N-acetyl-D-mannosaminuronic acid dehydrogenase